MNKYLPVVAIVLLLLIGGGLFLASRNKPVQPGAANTSTGQGQTEDGSVITSIKDALTKSLSLECTYQDERGSQTKTYIKAGAVRAESKVITNGSETNSNVIFKDRKMYTWDTATKKGFVFEVPEETMQDAQSLKTTPSKQNSGTENKGENFLEEIEKYKDACKPAVVSDSLFTPPTDVEFQDMSAMFKNLPTGAMPDNGIPSGFNFEELKKQYSPESQ